MVYLKWKPMQLVDKALKQWKVLHGNGKLIIQRLVEGLHSMQKAEQLSK